MALSDFSQEFQLEKGNLYTVICINQKPGCGTESRINCLIYQTIEKLKEEITDYNEIHVAYVYETPGLMGVRKFEILNGETQPCYRDVCEKYDDHNMSHVFFIGFKMLEEISDDEKRLYYITDENLPRVNSIVIQRENRLEVNELLNDSDVEVVLCKPDTLESDIFEEYIDGCRNGKVMRL